jgi:hypothetical protein
VERGDEEDVTRYPLGEAPTWKQIAGSLVSDPTVLIPIWEAPGELERYEDSEEGSIEKQAAELFICFTCHLWILLNPRWRTRPEKPVNPRTVSSALKCWSVDGMLEELIEACFKPCLSGLEGGAGRPSMSFSDRRTVYFPVQGGQTLQKTWKRVGEAPGNIFKYQQVRKELDDEGKVRLDECIEELLGLCQCLPDSSRGKVGGWVWRVDQKRIMVVTNPQYYRMKRIGQKGSKTRKVQGLRGAPAHRSAMSTAIAMMVHEDVPEEAARRAYWATRGRRKEKQDRRSGRRKNQRKVPEKKKVEVESVYSSEGDDEEEEDEEEEEDGDEEEEGGDEEEDGYGGDESEGEE